jgi:hypothetical protein
MKKITLILLILFCIAAVIAQGGKQNVAVYMAGKEPVGAKGAHKMVGGELVKAISKSDKYSAINRTDEILQAIAKEHGYQRSGAVSDEQIKALGQQFGVQYLCIAEISEVKGGSFYLDVRLVDVVTATTINSATATNALKNNNEMMAVAQQVARELVGVETKMAMLKEGDLLIVTKKLEKERAVIFYGENARDIDHTNVSWIEIPENTVLEIFVTPKNGAKSIEVRIVKATIKVQDKSGVIRERESDDGEELASYFIPKRYLTWDFLDYTISLSADYLNSKIIQVE